MTCIIVDDEPLARTGIQLLLEKYPNLDVVGSFNRATTATEYLTQHAVDLIVLDIQMPGTNGIEFARSIGKHTMIIFITAYAEYALDSYEIDAIDYLVKPVNPQRFYQAVRKALDYESLLKQANEGSSPEFSSDYLLLRADRQFVRVELKDILYIEGLKDYVILFINDQKLITNMNLRSIHAKLPETQFLRVSKSYIINIQYVQTFDNNSVTISGKEIPIGHVYRDDFLKSMIRSK